MTATLIRGSLAWLSPGTLLEQPAVLLEGRHITWVGPGREAPPAYQEIAGDWFLMPGVVDHHVHLRMSDARAVVLGGVTGVRDLGWPPSEIFPVVDIAASTDFDGPEVTAVGAMITCPGGYPSRAEWAPAGTALEVEGPEASAAAVERMAEEGAAAIKVTLNADAGPTLSDSDLLAICEAAHTRGLEVTAHVQGRGQTERALGAGVDELAHCPWSERLPARLLKAVAGRMRMVSTLDIHSFGRPSPELDVAVENLAAFAGAGGLVRYGTDLGNGPIPPGIHVGEAAHLASAGLGPDRILHVLAGSRLREGEPASVVGLAGNPLEDLQALGSVGLVVRRGRVVFPDR